VDTVLRLVASANAAMKTTTQIVPLAMILHPMDNSRVRNNVTLGNVMSLG
jgi:hypothetical protein